MPEPAILRNIWLEAAGELEAAGIDDARFEAEVLLRHASGLSRAQLYASLSDEVDVTIQERFQAVVAERTGRKPLAYITGTREFYRLEFQVTPDVLIPRPESELLVDAALDHLRQARFRRTLAADVGAGSGAVGIALAKHRRTVQLVCCDVSRDALRVARQNARLLLPQRSSRRTAFVQGDLLTPLPGPFHCVVANLPYVPEERLPELEPEVAEHEPRIALTPGSHGTELILRLITQLPTRLHSNGIALLEIDPGQESAVADAARQMMPDAEIDVLDDISQQPRVIRIVAP